MTVTDNHIDTTTPRKGVAGLAGIAFVAVFVIGFALAVTGPSLYEGGSLEDYGAAYAGNARETVTGVLAFIVWPVAGALLVWAVAHIAWCLDRALGAPTRAGRVAVAGAVVMAVGLSVAGAAVSAAEHVAAGTGDGFPADPAVGYALELFGGQVRAICLWGGSLVLLAVAVAARRARLVPGWLLWAGVVAAPLLPLAHMFFMAPLLVFLLWLAVVGAMMRPTPGSAATAG